MQRFETKYDLLNAAYEDSGLKKGTILLLQYLVHKSDREKCFPAVDTIAKALNVCKRTVQYNMRKLEKAGYIIRKDRWYNHQQLSNQYVFNLGIVEDVPSVPYYTDADKEKIASCISSIPDGGNDILDEINRDNDSQGEINKAAELLKIYNMPLSSREKLLLVYLFHRAGRKGVVYDTPEVYMNAIGVGHITFMDLLKKLRAKNLIRVRYETISDRELILIKLTGNIWKEERTCRRDKSDTRRQKQQEINKHSQVQKDNIWSGKECVCRHGSSKTRRKIRKLSFLKRFLRKCKEIISPGLAKIRKILRL